MVLHFERMDNPLKQEIIRIADIMGNNSQKPSWQRLIKILEYKGKFGMAFKTDHDVLVIDSQIVVGDERLLLACLQHLRNADNSNGQAIVCKRNTLGDAPDSSFLWRLAVARSRTTRRSRWTKLGSVLFLGKIGLQ